jgi:hypothetical protein
VGIHTGSDWAVNELVLDAKHSALISYGDKFSYFMVTILLSDNAVLWFK